MFDKALFDKIVFNGSVEQTYYQTLAVTEISNATMSLAKTLYRTLAVIENTIAGLFKGMFKTLFVAESSIVSLMPLKRIYKILAVTIVGAVKLKLKFYLDKYIKQGTSYLNKYIKQGTSYLNKYTKRDTQHLEKYD